MKLLPGAHIGGTRVSLRATAPPRTRAEASEMLAMWRELTEPDAERKKGNPA
jgi:hypothetical protein